MGTFLNYFSLLAASKLNFNKNDCALTPWAALLGRVVKISNECLYYYITPLELV